MFLRPFTVSVQLLAMTISLVACSSSVQDERAVVAEVGSSYLYKDEVDQLVIKKNHLMDGEEFTDEYVMLWAMDELFYKKAAENVASSDEIERMVDNYRRSLILNIYQDALINQHLKPSISEDDINEFYANNSMLFRTDEALLKGIVMKVPEKAPKKNQVRKWCASLQPEDIENLEAYAEENSALLDYFVDEWRGAGLVASELPLTAKQLETRLQRDKCIEFKEDGWVYFVTADSLIGKGSQMPLSKVRDEIVELIINSKRAGFIKAKKQELYDEAVEQGKIKIYDR